MAGAYAKKYFCPFGEVRLGGLPQTDKPNRQHDKCHKETHDISIERITPDISIELLQANFDSAVRRGPFVETVVILQIKLR